MRSALIATSFLAVSLFASAARAEVIEVDLSLQPEGTVITQTVDPGSIEILVLNRMPLKTYEQKIIRRTRVIPALIAGSAGISVKQDATGDCAEKLEAIYAALGNAENEDAVGRIVRKAEADLRAAKCPLDVRREALEEIRVRTTSSRVTRIAAGEEITYLITRRVAVEGEDPKTITWTVNLETKPRGVFLTTYGASIIPDRDDRFFLGPTTTADEFVVTREVKSGGRHYFLPSVFFTWLPASASEKNFAIGPTAGLGAGSNVGVFAGLSALYNSNIQFAVGLSAFKTKRLKGKYLEGSTIQGNRTDDELYDDTVWPGWFTALTFRFGTDPYATKKADEPAEAAAP